MTLRLNCEVLVLQNKVKINVIAMNNTFNAFINKY